MPLSRLTLFLLALALTASIQTSASPLATGPLTFASDVWEPFTNEVGQPRIALELVEEALERAGVDSKTKILEEFVVTEAIKEGSYDGSAALWRNAHRETFLLYSDPYLENRLVLVGRKGSDVSAASLSELSGKRIALVKNYAYGDILNDIAEVEIEFVSSSKVSLKKVIEGEADYTIVDNLLIRYLAEYHNREVESLLAVATTPLSRKPLHLALSKTVPQASEILSAFNREIREMLADGSYNRILQLNWITADVDGDGKMEMILGSDQAGVLAPPSGYDINLSGKALSRIENRKRYYIAGNIYEGWDNVPDDYKVEEDFEFGGSADGVRLFEFDF